MTYNGGGNRQHLLHTGSALGSFVTDYYDVTGLDVAPLDGLKRGWFLVEDPGRALEYLLLMPGDLNHGAVWSYVASQDSQAAGGAPGGVDLVYHGLVVYGLHAFDVFA